MNLRELTSALSNARPRGTRSRKKRTKAPYHPGTLGLSAVSEAIRRDYGRIVSRRERKRLARQGKPFRPYYNWR
jgi:predicted alternative tryptophan synthase beta-subunit